MLAGLLSRPRPSTGADDLEATLAQVQSDLGELAPKVGNVCDEFSYYDGALEDIYLAAC